MIDTHRCRRRSGDGDRARQQPREEGGAEARTSGRRGVRCISSRVNRAKEICQAMATAITGGCSIGRTSTRCSSPRGDHWHTKLSIDSMEAGKTVYARSHDAHCRTGHRGARCGKRIKKVFRSGRTGRPVMRLLEGADRDCRGTDRKVTWAHASYNRQRAHAFSTRSENRSDGGAGKTGDDHIDWDMWLGTSGDSRRRFRGPQTLFPLRKYWPYNGGVATDLLYHKLAPAHRDRGTGRRIPNEGQREWRALYRKGRARHSGRFYDDGPISGASGPFLVSTLTNPDADPIASTGSTARWSSEACRTCGQRRLQGGVKVRTTARTTHPRARTAARSRNNGSTRCAARRGAVHVDLGCPPWSRSRWPWKVPQRRTMLWDAKAER